jgi:hypothetical protein
MSNIFLEDIKWSFSKLNLYDTCKYAFYLQYIQQNKGIENAFSQFGVCGHKILEKYSKNELEIFELSSEYKKIYSSIVTERFPPNKYKNLNNSYYESGLKYFDEFEGFDDYKTLGIEKEVNFVLDKYKFGGFIDLVLEDKDNNIIIVDHKSKSKMDKKEKEKYLKQLYLYSIPLIEEYQKYPKYLKFNMFRFQEWVTKEFDIKKLEETKKWAIYTIENIFSEEKWLPKSSEYFCKFICSFRNGVCEYKPQ